MSASSRVPGGLLPRGSWGGYCPLSISDLDLRFVLSRTGLASQGAPRVPESFSEPIPLPKGKPLVTLRDAAQSFNHPGDRHDPHCRTSLSPIVALIAGVLILILPSLLNYVVAIYLIVVGLIGLNGIYHFIN